MLFWIKSGHLARIQEVKVVNLYCFMQPLGKLWEKIFFHKNKFPFQDEIKCALNMHFPMFLVYAMWQETMNVIISIAEGRSKTDIFHIKKCYFSKGNSDATWQVIWHVCVFTMQFDTRLWSWPFRFILTAHTDTGAARSLHFADDNLSRYDPLHPAHNYSHFQWRKTPRMIEKEEDRCLQARRDGRSFYEEGVNIQVGSSILV